MDPFKRYPFLRPLLSPFWKRHQKTMALVIAAIAAAGQARSFAIATVMARWRGTRLDSAVNRFYRLLRNTRVDYTELTAQWARLLAQHTKRHLLVAVDWTEWPHDLRMLVAAAVVGRRAIPIFVQAFARVVWSRSQNARENTFLRLLVEALRRAGVTATILCDRGFRRVSWLTLLLELRISFVVRLMDDVLVELTSGVQKPLRDIALRRGEIRDLGWVRLRSDKFVEVRVIGYQAWGAAEPWWIATSEPQRATFLMKLYDRRMTIEEQFRDTKGRRFGVKLSWTQFTDPDALARFTTLLAVALLIWTATGVAAARRDPSLRLRCRQKGPRQSYVTIGLRIVTVGIDLARLTERSIRHLLEPPLLRPITSRGFGAAK